MSHAQLNARREPAKSSFATRYIFEFMVETLIGFPYKNSMNICRFLCLAGICLFWSIPTFGVEVEGRLHTENVNHIIIDANGKAWPIVAGYSRVATELDQLATGDFLDASLEPLADGRYLLTEIHFVGLCRLLGIWATDNSSVMEFSSFDDLKIHPRPYSFLYDPARAERFFYTLAPEQGPSWTLFLIQDSRVMTGRLQIERDHVTVEVWDGVLPKFKLELRPIYRPMRCS
jgi:hypothetical protein